MPFFKEKECLISSGMLIISLFSKMSWMTSARLIQEPRWPAQTTVPSSTSVPSLPSGGSPNIDFEISIFVYDTSYVIMYGFNLT